MDIGFINGSPKSEFSASEGLLMMLGGYLPDQSIQRFTWNQNQVTEQEIMDLLGCQVVVLAFPLYIDSIPSHLLRCMIQVEHFLEKHPQAARPMVYCILNNGFFDGKQTRLAVASMKEWSIHCGLVFGKGIGIGGGGMINSVKNIPGDHGPKKNVALALKNLARDIVKQQSGENQFLEMSYPGALYKIQAESGWRKLAKGNGLRLSDLNRQW